MENHNSFVVTHCRRVSGVFMRNSAVSYILVIIHLRGYKSDRTLRFVWTPGLSIVLKNTQKNPLLNAPEPGTGTPLIRLQVTCSTRLSSFSGTDIPLQQGHGRQWEDQGSGRRMPAHRHLAGDPWERDRERELRIRAFPGKNSFTGTWTSPPDELSTSREFWNGFRTWRGPFP